MASRPASRVAPQPAAWRADAEAGRPPTDVLAPDASEAPPPGRRHRADVVVVVVLIAGFALGLSAFGIVNNCFDRIDQTVASMSRIEAAQAYGGRPPGAAGPQNYAVFAANPDGSLAGALIVHLTASRGDMTVVAVPANATLPSGSTLAVTFADGIAAATQDLEQAAGVRMDHQFLVRLDQCADVITAVGGLRVDSTTMDAVQVNAYVATAVTPADRADRLARVVVSTVSTFSVVKSLINPGGFDQTMAALQPCLSVDTTLTRDEVRSLVSELRLRPDAIGSIVWPSQPAAIPSTPNIKLAFALDDFSSLPLKYQSRR